MAAWDVVLDTGIAKGRVDATAAGLYSRRKPGPGASLIFGADDLSEFSIAGQEFLSGGRGSDHAKLVELQRALEMSSRVMSAIKSLTSGGDF
jgi:hypothetical protein